MPDPSPAVVKVLGTLFRLVPTYSGPGKLANNSRLRHLAHVPKTISASTRWNHNLLCRLDDYVGRSIAFFGDLDPKLSWILETVLRPGDSFVDVGANLGLLTSKGAACVGAEGKVLAIDPQPAVLELLRQNIARNKLSQVTLAPVGVGEENSTLSLHVPQGNYGSASFCDNAKDDLATVKVPVRRFNELLRETGFTAPRAVKLDVEGWEAPVIRGAGQLWRDNPPPLIIFEFREPAGTQAKDTEAGALLQDLGYHFYRLPKNLFRPRLVAEPQAANLSLSHDAIAIHQSTSPRNLGFKHHQVLQ